MICQHCNEKFSDNLLVCPYCGKRKTDVAPPTEKPKKTPPQPGVKSYDMPTMKWYNFEIWFLFLVVPVFTIISLPFDVDSILDAHPDTYMMVYKSAALAIDLIMVVIKLIARHKLKNYKKSAPKWAVSTYLVSAILSFSLVLFDAIASGVVKNVLLYMALFYWATLIWDVLMVIFVKIYYKKRKTLFVN